jgi:hypothetical protein
VAAGFLVALIVIRVDPRNVVLALEIGLLTCIIVALTLTAIEQRARLGTAWDRLPVAFRSPVVRKHPPPTKPQPASGPRGLWDFRRDADRAITTMTTILKKMAAEMNRSTKLNVKHARRMATAAQAAPSVEKSYKLASQTAADINRHAGVMEEFEAAYRKARVSMTQNYTDWFTGQGAGTDLNSWATALEGMAEVSTASKTSVEG